MTDRPSYSQILKSLLPRPQPATDAPIVADLFAGCGGLGLGFESVGFRTVGFEMLEVAAETYRKNLHGDCHAIRLEETTELGFTPDIIAGGPPCQPFSVGGLQMGSTDPRDGFPAFLGAVDRYRPKIACFENVRGMLYRGRDYLDEITEYLIDLGYVVESRILKAVAFGVPQRRERLFVVAHQGGFEFPSPTIESEVTAGEALGNLAKSIPPNSKFLTPSMDTYVAKYEKASKCIRPRDLHLEETSRTVTCRNLNGATGDMMRIRLADGRRRRVLVREAAGLQSFPDWFKFSGAEGAQFNQIGNAVPPLLGRAIAQALWDCYHANPLSKSELKALAKKYEQHRQLDLLGI